MRTVQLVSVLLTLILSTGCNVGSLDVMPEDLKIDGDAGALPDSGTTDGCPAACPTGTTCVSGVCTPGDPCAGLCDEDEVCEYGVCVVLHEDPCEGVVCSNPGDVCTGGVCMAGEGDADGDGVRARDDCDDSDPAVRPGADEVCNGIDDDCDGEVDEGFDADGDGRTICGGGDPARADCDDDDPSVFPGAPESCNGVDDDCDGVPDDDTIDVGLPCGSDEGECRAGTTACRDGAVVCEGGVEPQAEICDGRDNDCDGAVDDGIASRPCAGACGSGQEQCIGGAWVCDAPETGECRPGEVQEMACDCGVQTRTCDGSCRWGGWSACSGSTCTGGATCCSGSCLMDVNNCGGCGAACPAGARGSCCPDGWGMLGCCPDTHPVCGYDGYCYAY